MALESTGKISSRLEVLRQRFLERAKEDIQQLRTLAEKTRRGEFSADGLLFCYQSLHKLSGSAGTFGLPELARISHSAPTTFADQAW
ncbi:Hpt domain-containing protein [uncultured Marinobacter sp.]|uniref:Hpt domain-containing protein n=2 Tax=unclassified Marinobacter TaxID=83889 RepID=UPI000C35F869|nr:hypothetical protein [Marinobacter sp.]MAO26116.1 hypothetical protein [Roseovarius sp.]